MQPAACNQLLFSYACKHAAGAPGRSCGVREGGRWRGNTTSPPQLALDFCCCLLLFRDVLVGDFDTVPLLSTFQNFAIRLMSGVATR
jgi:hypothetical protein